MGPRTAIASLPVEFLRAIGISGLLAVAWACGPVDGLQGERDDLYEAPSSSVSTLRPTSDVANVNVRTGSGSLTDLYVKVSDASDTTAVWTALGKLTGSHQV